MGVVLGGPRGALYMVQYNRSLVTAIPPYMDSLVVCS